VWPPPADPPHPAGLLRARRERQCNPRTAEKGDEIAPPQMIEPHVPPRFKERIASYSKWRIAVRGSVTYFAGHQETTECWVLTDAVEKVFLHW
jgi:hypothetical protein